MTEKIRVLLLALLQQDVVVASWGISEIEITPSKVSFCVNGFKYNGEVPISTRDRDNHYDISIGNQNIPCCDKKEIVPILDFLIECDSHYKNILEAFFEDSCFSNYKAIYTFELPYQLSED